MTRLCLYQLMHGENTIERRIVPYVALCVWPVESEVENRNPGCGAGWFANQDNLPSAFVRDFLECRIPLPRLRVAKKNRGKLRRGIPAGALRYRGV